MSLKIIVKSYVLGLALLGGFALVAAADADRKPVGIWNFDENDGNVVSDSSGNGNDGRISESNVKRVDGRIGKSLEFIPDNQNHKSGFVSINGFNKKYDLSKGMTIEAWIKFKNLKREAIYEIISDTQGDRGKGFRFIIGWQMLFLRSGDGKKLWEASSKTSKSPMKADTWYHIAGTYDGSVFKVYIDGELVGESEKNLTLTKGKDYLMFGAYGDGYAYGFDGIMDTVTIYDYARTDAQVLQDAKK